MRPPNAHGILEPAPFSRMCLTTMPPRYCYLQPLSTTVRGAVLDDTVRQWAVEGVRIECTRRAVRGRPALPSRAASPSRAWPSCSPCLARPCCVAEPCTAELHAEPGAAERPRRAGRGRATPPSRAWLTEIFWNCLFALTGTTRTTRWVPRPRLVRSLAIVKTQFGARRNGGMMCLLRAGFALRGRGP